ncbi:MAG: CPBP family glutamic-type intramembrane protease [Flavobacteriales bacterium]
MKKFITKYPVLLFFISALAFQYVVMAALWYRLSDGATMADDETTHMIFRARVFGPLIFVVLISYYLEGTQGIRTLFSSMLQFRASAVFYSMAFTWKFIYTYIGIAFVVLLGFAEWPGLILDNFVGGDHSSLHDLMRNMPYIVGIAFVEETAWMKFSVTRLQAKYSALTSCLLVGVGWALWYLPMFLVRQGVPDGYPLPVFMLSMISLTILLGWSYNMTRSGVILLTMQIVSNCAFFIIPVLPGWWNGNAIYINSFVAVNSVVAIGLVVFYGWRELGTSKRAVWGEEHQEVAVAEVEVSVAA